MPDTTSDSDGPATCESCDRELTYENTCFCRADYVHCNDCCENQSDDDAITCKLCDDTLTEENTCDCDTDCDYCVTCCNDDQCNTCTGGDASYIHADGALYTCSLCQEDTHCNYGYCEEGGFTCDKCEDVICGLCKVKTNVGTKNEDGDKLCAKCKTEREKKRKPNNETHIETKKKRH